MQIWTVTHSLNMYFISKSNVSMKGVINKNANKNCSWCSLIYIGSGLIFGKCFWVGLPITLMGGLLLSIVSWGLEKQQINKF